MQAGHGNHMADTADLESRVGGIINAIRIAQQQRLGKAGCVLGEQLADPGRQGDAPTGRQK